MHTHLGEAWNASSSLHAGRLEGSVTVHMHAQSISLSEWKDKTTRKSLLQHARPTVPSRAWRYGGKDRKPAEGKRVQHSR